MKNLHLWRKKFKDSLSQKILTPCQLRYSLGRILRFLQCFFLQWRFFQFEKLKLWQNSYTQIVLTLELWQISIYEEKKFKDSLNKNVLTPWQLRYFLVRILRFLQCFFSCSEDLFQFELKARLVRNSNCDTPHKLKL